MTALTDLSNDQLADEITTWAGRVAAGEARLVELIGEFDAREAKRMLFTGKRQVFSWTNARTACGLERSAPERKC